MSNTTSTSMLSFGNASWNSYSQYGHIGGIASGLDTDSIINSLMTAASIPLDKLNQQKQIWQWKQDDYRSVNSTLLDLRNSVFNLDLQSTFLAKTATSSDPTTVTATAMPTAGNASITISNIQQLATPAQVVAAQAVTKSGQPKVDPTQTLASQLPNLNWAGPASGTTFSLTINGESFTFDTTKDSLNSMIAKINGDSKAGVSVYYDSFSDKIAISTTATGANAQIKVTNDTTNVFQNLFGMNVLADGTLAQPGQSTTATGSNAIYTINGLATQSSSNTFSVNGMNITLLKAAPTSTITLQASPNVDAVFNSIKSFVDKYNSAIDSINKLYTEPRYSDYQPLTDAQRAQMTDTQIQKWESMAKSGILKGDSLLSDVLDNMRSSLSSQVQGVTINIPGVTSTSTASDLSQIGITTGQWYENGKLYIDETKLRAAIQNDPNGVMQLFTNTGADPVTGVVDPTKVGIAGRLYNALNNAINQIGQTAGNTTDLVDNSFIGLTIRDINQQMTDMKDRLAQKQQYYVSQFTALEKAIAQMNSQSQYLMSAFSSK